MDLNSKEWSLSENATALEVLKLGARVRRYLPASPAPPQIEEVNDDTTFEKHPANVPAVLTDQPSPTHAVKVANQWRPTAAANNLSLLSFGHTTIKRALAVSLVALIYLLLGSILCSIPSISHNLRWQGVTCDSGVFGSWQLWNNARDYLHGVNPSQVVANTSMMDSEPNFGISHEVTVGESFSDVKHALISQKVGVFGEFYLSISKLDDWVLDLFRYVDTLAKTGTKVESAAQNIAEIDLEATNIRKDHKDLADRINNSTKCLSALTQDSLRQVESTQIHLQSIEFVQNGSSSESYSRLATADYVELHDALVRHLQNVSGTLKELQQKAMMCQSHLKGFQRNQNRVSRSLEHARRVMRDHLNEWSFNPLSICQRKRTRVEREILLTRLSVDYVLPHRDALIVVEHVIDRSERLRKDVAELLRTFEGSNGLALTEAIGGIAIGEIKAAADATLARRAAITLDEVSTEEDDVDLIEDGDSSASGSLSHFSEWVITKSCAWVAMAKTWIP